MGEQAWCVARARRMRSECRMGFSAPSLLADSSAAPPRSNAAADNVAAAAADDDDDALDFLERAAPPRQPYGLVDGLISV